MRAEYEEFGVRYLRLACSPWSEPLPAPCERVDRRPLGAARGRSRGRDAASVVGDKDVLAAVAHHVRGAASVFGGVTWRRDEDGQASCVLASGNDSVAAIAQKTRR